MGGMGLRTALIPRACQATTAASTRVSRQVTARAPQGDSGSRRSWAGASKMTAGSLSSSRSSSSSSSSSQSLRPWRTSPDGMAPPFVQATAASSNAVRAASSLPVCSSAWSAKICNLSNIHNSGSLKTPRLSRKPTASWKRYSSARRPNQAPSATSRALSRTALTAQAGAPRSIASVAAIESNCTKDVRPHAEVSASSDACSLSWPLWMARAVEMMGKSPASQPRSRRRRDTSKSGASSEKAHSSGGGSDGRRRWAAMMPQRWCLLFECY
mmetsp:Transcript_38390/g.83084  ORF Transcript_38390/g.83084 Transcript_38390/m.83084 type:complete len:270 (+) Transcript_38390:998-1807(+)